MPSQQNIGLNAQDITVLTSAKNYRTELLSLIASAKIRIYITALYIQNDEAGREILHALYQAKQQHPVLDIKVFVDFHRAQRGLIGEKQHLGNRELYLALAKQYQQTIDIYGVPVKRKELMGVWHFKGMVFDNTVLYSGASINNIYFHQEEKYRLDRYYQIESEALSQSFCGLLDNIFVDNPLTPQLNNEKIASINELNPYLRQLKKLCKVSQFTVEPSTNEGAQPELNVTPLLGFGKRKNRLNKTISQLIQNSQSKLVMFTPYFNLPKPLLKEVTKALKRGVEVEFVIGDKKANDFYIENENDFSMIGIIPYIYETLLKRFLKRYRQYLQNGQLKLKLWQHDNNSFHLKGIVADNRWHLLTGSNLNPRAWSLDLENGLLIDDKAQLLQAKFADEYESICQHAQRIYCHSAIDEVADYPEKPQKLLKKLKMVQIDRILKRFL